MKLDIFNPRKKHLSFQEARWLLSLCVLLFMSSLLLFSASIVYFNRSRSWTSTYTPTNAFKAGQPIRMGKVSIRIDEVRFEDGSPPFEAPDGSHYAIAQITIQNVSDAPVQIMPSVDTYVKSPDGTVATLATYAYKNPFRAGELPAGEMIRGEVGYVVKKDSDSKLYVDALWSGGVLTFELEK